MQGRKSTGVSGHIITNPAGLLVGLVVHGADIQDWDNAPRFSTRSAMRARGFAIFSPTADMLAQNSKLL